MFHIYIYISFQKVREENVDIIFFSCVQIGYVD